MDSKIEHDLVCPVCHLDESDVGDEEIVKTECRHSYCRPCFAKLLLSKSTCPMCRGVLVEKFDALLLPIVKKVAVSDGARLGKLRYDTPYHLIVIEMQIVRQHIFLPNPKPNRNPRKLHTDHAVYDFVVYDVDGTTVYERHRNVPIGGTEAPPIYILQLLGYAQHVSYESAFLLGKGSDSYLVRARLQTFINWYNKFNKVAFELPSLPWEGYRLMNYAKQEYGQEMPLSIHD